MIQYTLENNFIVYLTETLLVGLAFLVLSWSYLYEKVKVKRSTLSLIIGFASLSAFLLFRCLWMLLLSADADFARLESLFLLVSYLETRFVLSVLVSYGPPLNTKASLQCAFVPLLLLATAGLDPFFLLENQRHLATLNAALALVTFLFLCRNPTLRASLAHWAVGLIALSYLCEFLFLSRFSLVSWNVQHLVKLMGLVCFVLHLDRWRPIVVQFLIRINLVFIGSAGLFMLVISDVERKNHIELSSATVRDLAEFVRGQVIYHYREGENPADILGDEAINLRVVSEFGRIPNLKEVRVHLLGPQLWMEIDADGIVSYRSGENLFSLDPETTLDFARQVVTILRVPIVADGEQLGMVEIGEDLFGLTQRMSGHMRLVFLSFTTTVMITLFFGGLIVVRAHKLIRYQYQKLGERKRELMQASHLATIGQLVGGVAHEVNNPMGVVLIRSECALSSGGYDESVKEDLLEIRNQATRVTKIVRSLLAFSRPKPIRIINVNLNEVIIRSRALLDSYKQLRGFDIRMELDPSLPLIPGDSDRLEQMIINIGKNAIDAMPRGGCLTFRTRRVDHSVSLEVKDTGEGISPEIANKIFEPFFSTKEIDRGTGLGLAISSRIIKDHQGSIEVESKSGLGTTVRVLLPLRRRSP